ncbi:MAG: stalk domain-containing protein [Pseudoflavonifractor sp.]|nr:stalk domain-containing protein [Pseudoflavonifractor sp.]
MKRNLLALLCAAVLVLALLPLAAGAAGEVQVYHLAVNDKLIDAETGLSAANMPVAVGGMIYVPYTTFDKNVTGVDLGIAYGLYQEGNTHTLTLYSLGGTIVFDINAQTCTVSNTGMNLDMRAIIRNGKVYVPANGVCQFFGLQYSYRPTRSAGVLIRITNNYAVLSDLKFMQSAASLMQDRYDRYMQSLAVTPSPVPTGSGTVTTPPATSDDPDEPGVWVYLGVECTDGGGAERILETLERWGARAVFFFRPEELAGQEALVRRVLGAGHQVGLLADGSSLETARDELARGNDLLERLAWTRVHTARLTNESRETARALAGEGWKLWSTSVDGRPGKETGYLNTNAIVTKVKSRRTAARLLLNDSGATASNLSRLLNRLEEENCVLRIPLETELA